MLGSQRSHCHDKTNSGFVDSSEGVGRKGRMSSTTDRYRAGILDGHRDFIVTLTYTTVRRNFSKALCVSTSFMFFVESSRQSICLDSFLLRPKNCLAVVFFHTKTCGMAAGSKR